MIDQKTAFQWAYTTHILGAALIIVAFAYLLGSAYWYYYAGVTIAYAAVKEFWYDENYETVEVRGSNLTDFLYYIAGVALGLAIVCLKNRFFSA